MIISTVDISHFPSIQTIFKQGMDTGIATLDTEVPTWEEWNAKFIPEGRLVICEGDEVIGWAAISKVSQRKVYKGVGEITIYIASGHQGKGIGTQLLQAIIHLSEELGYWTLQSHIWPENITSIRLHEKCGFRKVGIREQFGQRNGIWKDILLMERRSPIIR